MINSRKQEWNTDRLDYWVAFLFLRGGGGLLEAQHAAV